MTIADTSMFGCGVAAGEVTSTVEETPVRSAECPGIMRDRITQAAAAVPTDAIVWMSRWERMDQVVDGRVVAFASPEGRALVLAQMEGIYQLLRAYTPAPIFIVSDAAPGPGDYKDGARRGARSEDHRYVRLADLQRRFAASHRADVVFLDLARRVCPNGPPCDALRRFNPRQQDGEHLTTEGSVWAARWVIPKFALVPRLASPGPATAAAPPTAVAGARACEVDQKGDMEPRPETDEHPIVVEYAGGEEVPVVAWPLLLRDRLQRQVGTGDRYRWWVLWTVLVGLFASGFTITILAVSLGGRRPRPGHDRDHAHLDRHRAVPRARAHDAAVREDRRRPRAPAGLPARTGRVHGRVAADRVRVGRRVAHRHPRPRGGAGRGDGPGVDGAHHAGVPRGGPGQGDGVVVARRRRRPGDRPRRRRPARRPARVAHDLPHPGTAGAPRARRRDPGVARDAPHRARAHRLPGRGDARGRDGVAAARPLARRRLRLDAAAGAPPLRDRVRSRSSGSCGRSGAPGTRCSRSSCCAAATTRRRCSRSSSPTSGTWAASSSRRCSWRRCSTIPSPRRRW